MKKLILIFFFILILAGCQPKEKFTVQFVDYDGSIIETQTLFKGESATEPQSPTREGYTFTGWDSDFTNITENKTITALYQINKYTVNFYNHDGTLLKTEEVEYQKSATPPTVPERTGYVFTGWNQDYNVITKDTNLNAVFEKAKLNVYFYNDQEELMEQQEVYYGEDAIAPNPPQKEGYTFIGWDKQLTNITNELHIYPLYEINEYEVVFKDHNGNVLKTEILEYGSNATPPEVPTRIGYRFICWDKDYTNVKDNLVITTTYEPIKYQISFFENSPTVAISWANKEDFLNEFYRDFFDWLDNNVGIIPTLTKSNDTYQFILNGKTITWTTYENIRQIDTYDFELTLGNLIYKPFTRTENVTIAYDSNYFLNTEPYRSKYIELDNYFLNVINTSYSSYDTGYNANGGKVQIFFRFQQWNQGTSIPAFNNLPKKHVANLPEGTSYSLPEKLEYTIEDEVSIPDPTSNGVIFLGWYDNPYGAGNKITTIKEGSTNNLLLFAMWDFDATVHKVTFIDNDKIISTQEIRTGETLSIPNITPKDGYEFIGWDKNLNDITTDITVTSQYKLIEYTIKYHANTEKDVTLPTEPLVYTIEDEFTLPTLKCDGLIFIGWYSNPEGTGNVITKTTTGNLNLYARWLDPNDVSDKLTVVAHNPEIEKGRTTQVYAKFESTYCSVSSVTFFSADPEIATVDENGFVRALKLGKTMIIAIRGSEVASMEIEVVEKEYEVKWVGHQGSGGPVVQNTLSAFEEGGKRGYYAMECDVRVSLDGVYYICHDDSFKDYLFVDESLYGKIMNNYTWDQLKTYKVKDTYKGKTYYDYLCTVEDYLLTCKKYGAKAVLELKSTNGISSSDQSRINGLITLVKNTGMYQDAIFLTSMKNCLTHIRKYYPDANIQFLSGSTTTTKENIDWCIENRFSIDAPHDQITEELVTAMHNAGLYVNAYTVDSEETANRLMQLKVDMITTNNLGVKK